MNGISIFIDSHKKVSGTHSDFYFNIADYLQGLEKSDFQVMVSRAAIPKSWYLITGGPQGLDNVFTLEEEGHEPISLKVPEGNYTIDNFQKTVNDLMTQASPSGAVYTSNFNDINGKITWTSSIDQETTLTMPAGEGTGLYTQFGFESGVSKSFVGGTLTSDNVCSVVLQDSLLLHSSMVDDKQGILQDMSCSAVPFGASLIWESYHLANAKPLALKSGLVHFWLTDQDGKAIDTNGIHISFTLRIFKNTEKLMLQSIPHLLQALLTK